MLSKQSLTCLYLRSPLAIGSGQEHCAQRCSPSAARRVSAMHLSRRAVSTKTFLGSLATGIPVRSPQLQTSTLSLAPAPAGPEPAGDPRPLRSSFRWPPIFYFPISTFSKSLAPRENPPAIPKEDPVSLE